MVTSNVSRASTHEASTSSAAVSLGLDVASNVTSNGLSPIGLVVVLICGVITVCSYIIERRRRRNHVIKHGTADVMQRCSSSPSADISVVPESVNYHMTRRCNYRCGFCFHTAKTSFQLPVDEAKRGLRMLQDAGMVKINFSGGEPFLPNNGRFVGELVKYCKLELGLASVSIVSNGSLIREKWFETYGDYLDILAISCDSFDPCTNAAIGRQQQQQRKDHLQSLANVRDWCTKYKVAFKLNTVVNTYNKDEDMTEHIEMLRPVRWKVFQCLLIDGENAGDDALRNAERYVISDDEFHSFLLRHSTVSQLVPESNDAMRYSYLILDEYMRFLDGGTKKPSKSILDVGVQNAIDGANFDDKMFLKRGGKYIWSKADMNLEW